jgi:hypothetical protein
VDPVSRYWYIYPSEDENVHHRDCENLCDHDDESISIPAAHPRIVRQHCVGLSATTASVQERCGQSVQERYGPFVRANLGLLDSSSNSSIALAAARPISRRTEDDLAGNERNASLEHLTSPISVLVLFVRYLRVTIGLDLWLGVLMTTGYLYLYYLQVRIDVVL